MEFYRKLPKAPVTPAQVFPCELGKVFENSFYKNTGGCYDHNVSALKRFHGISFVL